MGQSWSGIRKKLEEELICESLKGRIQYFITKYHHAHDDEARFALRVDNKEILHANIFKFYKQYNPLCKKRKEEKEIPKRRYENKRFINDKINSNVEDQVEEELREKGIFAVYSVTDALDEYLHQSIELSINSKNPIVRMFAVMDRRIGKRRIKELVRVKEEQPKWLQYFYELRITAEEDREYGAKSAIHF